MKLSQEQHEHCKKLTELYAPKVLPPAWRQVDSPMPGQRLYEKSNGLQVIFTADNLWEDGKTWLHISLARALYMPSYEDMKEVKDIFIGKCREALQVFPRADKHIDIHPFCLHLWCAVEGNGLPDFGKEGTI